MAVNKILKCNTSHSQMKTLFIFFFLSGAILSGCSTAYNYSSKKITIRKTNGTEKEYSLLSVRGDSAVTVLDWQEENVYPIPFSHITILKNDSIVQILRKGKGGGIRSTIGGISGAIAGGAVASAFMPFTVPGVSFFRLVYYPIFFLIDLAVLGSGAVLGVYAGSAIGDVFPPSKELDPRSTNDREFLRSISAYPDKEPDEMKNVR